MGPRNANGDSLKIILDVKKLFLKSDNYSELIGNFNNDEESSGQITAASSTTGATSSNAKPQHESHFTIGSQVILPFFVAGLAMVGAGLFLDVIQTWPVFINVPEIIILVPALLGLKGNLEQTLASRLSTEANIGNMETGKSKIHLIVGNLALVQCQATIVGFLASVLAILMELAIRQNFNVDNALLLGASSIFTASIASLVLGIVTSAVIVAAKSCKINPDNIATPVAASLGDITSLIFLATSASALYSNIHNIKWVAPTIIIAFIVCLPFWICLARRNEGCKEVLKHGWTPVLVAMMISTVAGFILDVVVGKYSSVAVFQPLVNGVAGNLVAIQASKMSTQLHKESEMGVLPSGLRICISPIKVFFSKLDLSITARVLMFFVIPGHLTFAYIISFIKTHQASLSPIFLVIYLTAVFIQVAILIYLAVVATSFFWKHKKDPDNMTIPYLTALADLLGVCFLGIVFELLNLMGEADVLQ